MKLRHHFRDLQEWSDQGLTIKSTSSNCAVKLFDSALTQYVGWYDDDIGMATTVEKMLNEDPNFILGRALSIGLDLIGTGTSIRRDPKLNAELIDLKQLAEKCKSAIEWREYAHVQALDLLANGNMAAASQIWEQILQKYPTDMLALKLAHDVYFYLGDKRNILDSIERVYSKWETNQDPLQGYIHGMYSFGLEEHRRYSEAEKQAKLGLQKIPQDAWAVHALAHVHEMQKRTDEGITAIYETEKDWKDCNYLACHNYWHWSLFHIELDRPESASSIYESRIGPQAKKSGNMLDIVDATSLLYRLDLLFPKKYSGNHWQSLYSVCEPHFEDHILGFNTVHFTMACLGNDRQEKAEELLEGFRLIKSTGIIKDHWIDITEQVLQSMIDFKREKYQCSLDRLMAIKNDLLKMGGSDAQRDVFNQLMLVAAVRAGANDVCRNLLNERQSLRGNDVVVRELIKAMEKC